MPVQIFTKRKILSTSPLLVRRGSTKVVSYPLLGQTKDTPTVSVPTGFLLNGTRLIAQFESQFPLKENPNLDIILPTIVADAIQAGIYPKDSNQAAIIANIKKSYFAQLALNAIPTSTSVPFMKKMILWIFTLFAYDNLIDERDSHMHRDRQYLKDFSSDLNKILTKRSKTQDILIKWLNIMSESELDKKLITETILWLDLLSKYPFTKGFIVEATKYFDSSLEEMDTGMNTKTEHYIDTRRVSGAVPSVTALAESDMQPTPAYLSTNHAFTEMEKEYDDCIWAVNDLAGAKEMNGHEPNFLKTKMREKLRTYTATGGVANSEVIQQLFTDCFQELIEYINTRHKKWIEHKTKVIEDISSGRIFANESSGQLDPTKSKHQKIIRSSLEDFQKRCQIRENLFASGNECTRVSSRYYNPEDPKLNIEVTKLSFIQY